MPPETEVITDLDEGKRDPWRGYQRCLSDLPDCTHLVVIQDDAIVCQNFAPAIECVVAARPESVILLFVGGLRGKTSKNFLAALFRGESFCDVWFRDIHHVVAVLWPRALAEDFLHWGQTTTIPGLRKPYRSDDAVFGAWTRYTKRQVIATVPCLVEHPDDVLSTIGRTAHAGKDKGRVALQFCEGDPLEINWI